MSEQAYYKQLISDDWTPWPDMRFFPFGDKARHLKVRDGLASYRGGDIYIRFRELRVDLPGGEVFKRWTTDNRLWIRQQVSKP